MAGALSAGMAATQQIQPTGGAPIARAAPTTPAVPSPAASTATGTGYTAPPTPTMPTVSASTGGTAASMGTGVSANASNTVLGGNANEMTADSAANLSAITEANNPYMQLARQSGQNTAAARGLGNSSVAAGSSEAAATAAAAPLAEQNASEVTQAALQNSQLQTQASEFTASQEQQAAAQNAQLEQQQSQFGAGQTQAAATTTAQITAAAKEQTQNIQATLENTGLQGLNADTLAKIQGSVSLGIAAQQSTNSLLTAASNGINAVLSNANIAQPAALAAVTAIKNNLIAGLAVSNIIQGGTPTSDPWGANTAENATPTNMGSIGPNGGYVPPKKP